MRTFHRTRSYVRRANVLAQACAAAAIIFHATSAVAQTRPSTRATTVTASAERIPEGFDILPFHSQVEFSVPFMGLAKVKGAFEDFSGHLLYDAKTPLSSSITFIIQTASLHTGNAQRDRHLASDDFFNTDTFPTIKFQSDRIMAGDRAGSYVAIGRLTMHGVTKQVRVPVVRRHGLRLDGGINYIGFDVALRLNWRDYGIRASNRNNSWFQPARMLVNDFVDIAISIEGEHRIGSALQYAALDGMMELLRSRGVAGVRAMYETMRREKPDSVARFTRPLLDAGNALISKGSSDDGIAAMLLYLDANPDDGNGYAALGRAYLDLGKVDLARAALRRATEKDADQPMALELLRRLPQ